jgi:hypothetical protein
MDDNIRNFGETLGRAAIARDWNAVHQLLAPWLRDAVSPDQVRLFFEDEYRRTLEASGVAELHHPEYPDPYIGGNDHTNASALREPISWAQGKVRAVPPAVTDENMRFWMKLQLQCSDDQAAALDFDSFCEVWIAVVETPEGLRVGYWSQGAY